MISVGLDGFFSGSFGIGGPLAAPADHMLDRAGVSGWAVLKRRWDEMTRSSLNAAEWIVPAGCRKVYMPKNACRNVSLASSALPLPSLTMRPVWIT